MLPKCADLDDQSKLYMLQSAKMLHQASSCIKHVDPAAVLLPSGQEVQSA